MKIDKDMRVEIEYSVKLDSGEIVKGDPKEGLARRSFIYGRGQFFPALEEKLKGLEPNDEAEVTLSPKEAFGERREDLIKQAPLKYFPPNVEAKKGRTYKTKDDKGKDSYFVIKDIKDDIATLDFNHPLAGENLHFDITIRSVRPASAEELSKAQ